MLFVVNSKIATDEVNFFELNPGANAIAEYAACTSRQMFFVCLVADNAHDSPLRTLPDKEKRMRASQVAGWGMEGNRPDKNARNLIAGKVEVVEKAIEQYRKDQYDEQKAMIEAIDAQIKEALALMTRNKEEACRRVKTRTTKGGVTTTEEYIDQGMVSKMALDAMKLGAALPDLRASRLKLQSTAGVPSPIDNTILHSAADIDVDYDQTEEVDEKMSELDIYMEKKRQIHEQN